MDIEKILEPEYISFEEAAHITGQHISRIYDLAKYGYIDVYSIYRAATKDIEFLGSIIDSLLGVGIHIPVDYDKARTDYMNAPYYNRCRPKDCSYWVKLDVWSIKNGHIWATSYDYLDNSGNVIGTELPPPAKIGVPLFRFELSRSTLKARQVNELLPKSKGDSTPPAKKLVIRILVEQAFQKLFKPPAKPPTYAKVLDQLNAMTKNCNDADEYIVSANKDHGIELTDGTIIAIGTVKNWLTNYRKTIPSLSKKSP